MRPSVFVTLGIGLLISVVVATAAWLRHSDFDLPACDEKGQLSLLDGLVARGDYASLRSTEEAAPLHEAGTRCATAKDKDACEAAVKNAQPTTGNGFPNGTGGRRPGRLFFVLTRGDEVTVLDAPEQLGPALSPIDTPHKAAVLARWRYDTPVHNCDSSVRRSAKGFEVHLSTDSCFGPADYIIEVEPNGDTTTKAESHGAQTCVGARTVTEETRVAARTAARPD